MKPTAEASDVKSVHPAVQTGGDDARVAARRSPWPDNDKRLIALVAAGKSYRQIAGELGVTRGAIAGRMSRLGLKASEVDAETVLFPHLSQRAADLARLAKDMDALAERISKGRPVITAGREMGLSRQRSQRVFREICKRLGPQAA